MTHGKECIWDEIGEEMFSEGNKILAWYDKKKVPSTKAKMHRAVRYHLYHHYACTMTELGSRGGHVQVPDCVKKYIKLAYLGDGNFVGYKEHPTKKRQAKIAQGK